MRRIVLLSCGLVLLTAPALRADETTDELFALWEKQRKEIRTLVVHFDFETRDLAFNHCERWKGTLRLLHTRDGRTFAAYEVEPAEGKGRPEKILLYDGSVYVLDDEKKVAFKWEPEDGDVLRFLRQHGNPFLVLLEGQRARPTYQLTKLWQTEEGVVLKLKSIEKEGEGTFTEGFREGVIEFALEGLGFVPKGMPTGFNYSDTLAHVHYEYKVSSYKINHLDGPTLSDFRKPDDCPDWQVFNVSAFFKK